MFPTNDLLLKRSIRLHRNLSTLGPYDKHLLLYAAYHQQFCRPKHEMIQSNSLKVKRPSSAITPTEHAVGRAVRWLKDGRLEAVYVVYERWLMTRAISDTERHTLAAHLRSVSLPNTKCGKDWTLNTGSLCSGSKKEKDFSARKQSRVSAICCRGRLEKSASPTRVNESSETGPLIKNGLC